MYDGYVKYGGTEIANVDRLVGYARSAGCSVHWLKATGCGTLSVAVGDGIPYSLDRIYDAPWYDPSVRDLSSRFFGVMVIDQRGVNDSSRQISAIEGIVDGGTIAGQRRGMREVRYRVILVSEGKDALEYGMNWLTSALDGGKCGQHGDRCGTSDLQFFVECPTPHYTLTVDGEEIPPPPAGALELVLGQPAEDPIVNYAPRIRGSGEYATVRENLFTNPRLVGDGTWAEVRRNLVTNPRGVGLSGWEITRQADRWTGAELSEGGEPFTRYTRSENGGTFLLRIPAATPVVGTTYSFSVEIRSSVAATNVRINAAGFIGDYSPVPANEWVRLELSATAEGYTLFTVNIQNALASGTEVDVRRPTMEVAPTPGGYFDGSTTPETAGDVIQPEDFRWRWLGEPNDSESVMEGERVAGFSPGTTALIVSTWGNKPAARQIALTTNTFNQSSVTSIPSTGTFMATAHYSEPLQNPSSTPFIRTQSPVTDEFAPLEGPGDYPLRSVYEVDPGIQRFQLRLSQSTPGDEVWYTDIGLFEGDYNGEVFNGESDPADIGIAQPEDFLIRWTGEVDKSSSVMEIERVAGFVESNAIAGVSTREGKPAVRLISTGSELGLALVLASSTASSVTGAGTVSLDAPLQGTLDSRALTLHAGGVEVSAPNLAGNHPLRVTGGEPTLGQVGIALANGATQGNGDVWWTDIALVEGEYDGPYFDGDTGWVQINGVWRYATWSDDLNSSFAAVPLVETVYRVPELTRFMHDAVTSSGPLLIRQLPLGENARYHGAEMEFTITSERGYIFSAPRELNLDRVELSSVSDIDVNLVPNPRSRLLSSTTSIIARNAVSNPNFETTQAGWTGTGSTLERPFQELRSQGDYSLKVNTVSLAASASHAITAASRSAALFAKVSAWVAIIANGPKAPIRATLSCGGVERSITSGFGGSVIELDDVPVPASGDMSVTITGHWQGGTTQEVSMYVDTVMFLQVG